jgi:hypothetical protein
VICNLCGVGGSFYLRAKNWRTRIGSVLLSASFPNPSLVIFLSGITYRRLFYKLPMHFLPCVGFKLGGIFLGCLGFSIGCLILFISYLDWLLGC